MQEKNYIKQFAWTKALMAVATKRQMIRVETTIPMTFSLLNHTWLFQPMVWNMLQKPWQRCSQMAANHTR